jgi:hypothetical protein
MSYFPNNRPFLSKIGRIRKNDITVFMIDSLLYHAQTVGVQEKKTAHLRPYTDTKASWAHATIEIAIQTQRIAPTLVPGVLYWSQNQMPRPLQSERHQEGARGVLPSNALDADTRGPGTPGGHRFF